MNSNLVKSASVSFLLSLMPAISAADQEEYNYHELPAEVIAVLQSDTQLKMAGYRDRMEDPLYPSDLTTVNLKGDEYYNSSDTDVCEEETDLADDSKDS